MKSIALAASVLLMAGCAGGVDGVTTLSGATVRYQVADKPYVVLKRADVTAVIVDNRAVNDDVLPNHKAGYSGVAKLAHTMRDENLFVPFYAGLNFEHIHDGTVQDRNVLFEPRNAPMELRVIDRHTVELYQKPTPHWKLESCHRYRLLEDGTIEMTFQCVPRAKTFANGYIGLFWASYIHQPESLDIHFAGWDIGKLTKELARLKRVPVNGHEHWERFRVPRPPRFITASTPLHGVRPTHVGLLDGRVFKHDDAFPLSLVFNKSDWIYGESWYYGVSHRVALVQMFRDDDRIRFSQSPSGGGKGNPAWDFQYFIEDYEVDKTYGFVMRAKYMPFDVNRIVKDTARHRRLLGSSTTAEQLEDIEFWNRWGREPGRRVK